MKICPVINSLTIDFDKTDFVIFSNRDFLIDEPFITLGVSTMQNEKKMINFNVRQAIIKYIYEILWIHFCMKYPNLKSLSLDYETTYHLKLVCRDTIHLIILIQATTWQSWVEPMNVFPNP